MPSKVCRIGAGASEPVGHGRRFRRVEDADNSSGVARSGVVNDVDRLIDAGLLRKTQERGSARIHYSWSHEILGRRWPQFADRVARDAAALTTRQSWRYKR